ncbi:MAG: DNA cytosine methyltransferase [Prosthecobacter sp.]|uniref:DNA cytosine methyltransferase n=1 Tax=Prosthecobacter sp. TaxID=1965333 RepID=UPI002610A7AE|nr:DNA cytosine methyltransferase [Prosthecobacter sp.]MCF7789399.1 DNA cytosine methyltransferase [Prosthecobacter sp.]
MRATYIQTLRDQLQPSLNPNGYKVLDLFAGCGGLSVGFEAAGFDVTGYEMNRDACATYNASLHGKCIQELLTTETVFPAADVIIGGPPCQPFSVIGHQAGQEDRRNGLEVFAHAVKSVQPKVWMFENVRGLLGRSKEYLDTVLAKMTNMGYAVEQPLIINARHYGVPQNRERVVVVGHRLPAFLWPEKLEKQFTVRSAIGRTARRTPRDGRFLTQAMDCYIAKYEKASCCRQPRDLHLDMPARTLTCRNLGGATGDMIRLRLPDGRRRLLTVAEAARLQSFPPWFRFAGSHTSRMNQIGNAVPPMLALMLGNAVKDALLGE